MEAIIDTPIEVPLLAAFDDEAPSVPLQVYARHAGAEIRIVVGPDRLIGEGIRLVDNAFFDDADSAAAVAAACATYLDAARMPPDPEGWYPFPAFKVPTLLHAARNLAWAGVSPSVTSADEAAGEPVETASPKQVTARVRLTHRRAAWFGFLVGRGYGAKRIAGDEVIRSSVNNVYRIANRLGLSLSSVPHGEINLNLPLSTSAVFERLAAQAHQQPEMFIQRMLIRAAKDPARYILPLVSS